LARPVNNFTHLVSEKLRLMRAKLLIENVLDRKRVAQVADWAAVGVAVSLPWSTSATSILLVVWLITLLPTLDITTVRREVETAAGGFPVLLWLLAALGMLWAVVSWTDRIHGLGGFHRLLVIPLLLAQFRRSKHGAWVLFGFLASAAVLLLVCWALVLARIEAWPSHLHQYGVLVRDSIGQSSIFLICAIGLIWPMCDALRERNWQRALWPAGLAILFLAYLMFIVTSRAAIAVAPVLLVLLGWRRFGWKGVMTACITVPVLATALWATSPNLREFFLMSVQQTRAYSANAADNSIGEHLEFLRKSLRFVREAPLIGHGTGSIADLFRRSAIVQTGAAGVATVNPHSQIFGVAIQLGLVGTAVLLAMWTAHYLLFCSAGWVAWAGTVVVVENIVSSLAHSHLFDFMHGWLYVFGVGVVGGMVLRRSPQHQPGLQHSQPYIAPRVGGTAST
jgi:O-antigen ligase